jgi:hypothetical protein
MANRKFTFVIVGVILSWFLSGSISLSVAQELQPLVLFDFAKDFDIKSIITNDANCAVSEGGVLRIETGHKQQWPGVTLRAPAGKWDLSKYEYVSMEVKNSGDRQITVFCRVDNPGADGDKNCITDNVTLMPQAAGTLVVSIFPVPWRLSEPAELIRQNRHLKCHPVGCVCK